MIGPSIWSNCYRSSLDANGNTLTDASGRQYSWDFENRLTQVVNPGVGTTTFRYDPFGRRIQKSGPLGTTNYLYDGFRLVEEVGESGSILASYTQGLRIDEPFAEFRSGVASYYEADDLGSITSLTNASSTLADTFTYDGFGNLTASTGSVLNSLRFAARESDSETGLYYYRARYLDTSAGRFISEDPSGRWPRFASRFWTLTWVNRHCAS
jgi:RHS repeat-associated protein